MAPSELYMIRHAQGFHNLSVANHSMRDPLLTDKGKEQCAELATKLPETRSFDLIVASPIKRTLHTALLTFKSLLEVNPDMKIIALPTLQETSDLPCDTGSELSELQREFSGQPIDFSLVHDGWYDKSTSSPYAPEADKVNARAQKARKFLQERKEQKVAAVTHGGFLHYFTEDWSDAEQYVGTGWRNCEFRVYNFDTLTPEDKENASIVETKESYFSRKGTDTLPTKAERLNLMNVALHSWGKLGYMSPQADKNAGTETEAASDHIKVQA